MSIDKNRETCAVVDRCGGRGKKRRKRERKKGARREIERYSSSRARVPRSVLSFPGDRPTDPTVAQHFFPRLLFTGWMAEFSPWIRSRPIEPRYAAATLIGASTHSHRVVAGWQSNRLFKPLRTEARSGDTNGTAFAILLAPRRPVHPLITWDGSHDNFNNRSNNFRRIHPVFRIIRISRANNDAIDQHVEMKFLKFHFDIFLLVRVVLLLPFFFS